MEEKIRLQSKDGKEYEISKKAAELSDLLRGTMSDYPNETSIPLPEIDEKTIDKVLDYLTHFNGISPPEIEKPLKNCELKDATDEWSVNFVDKITMEELVNLTVAGNFMGINSLLDLCCAKIASMCKDKTEEEIFKVFNITETLTVEEKDKIKADNKWIEENI